MGNRTEYFKQWNKNNPDKVKAKSKKYYEKNKEAIATHAKSYRLENKDILAQKTKIKRREMSQWFQNLKSTYSCATCGENHVACLSFHHNNPREKEITMAHAYNSWGKERILKEIKKCTVLCENCHRKLHYTVNFYNPYYEDAI